MDGYLVIKSELTPMTLDQAVARVHGLSTLPQVAMRVVQLVNDPAAGAVELTRAVESDPALCARLLRCVNSAAYALRFKITNVHRAVAYLGFKAVRNLALTASISESFKKDLRIDGYSRLGLWRHLVSVAIASRMTARRAGVRQFEEAFLAGLLHDLGLILEDQYCHAHFESVIRALNGTRPLVDVEREVLGFDHSAFGQRIAENWKFPEEAAVVIAHHHAPEAYDGPHRQVLACVAVAELICLVKGHGEMDHSAPTACPQAVETLALDVEGLRVLCDDLEQELSDSALLFQTPDHHD